MFNPINRRVVVQGCTLAVLSLLASAAQAQMAWPTKAVKIVVPYGPGGAVDLVTRKMAQKLTEQTGQSFFIENKAGATGTIGANQVAQSAADGYTLMANDTTFSLLPHIFKKLPFDSAVDLMPVGAFVFAPMGLAVNAQSRFKTLPDLVAEAKNKPNQVTYGTGGPGTTPHFASEALGIASGANFMHIPFKGAGEATQAILSSTIDFQIASTTGLMGNVKGGKLRLLAASGDKRLGALPEALARLQKEIVTAMASADMKAFAEGMGAEARQVGSDAFGRMLKYSTENWGKVVTNTALEKQ